MPTYKHYVCRQEKWWEVDDFKEKPFDVIFDCAEGTTAWQHARTHKVLKGGRQGGRFIAVGGKCAPSPCLLAAAGTGLAHCCGAPWC